MQMLIHFKKPDDWKNVYMHYWDNADPGRKTQWPGKQIGKAENNWYEFNFEETTPVNLVFNDGEKAQTRDLFLDKSEAWILKEDPWYFDPDIFRICVFPGGKYKALVMSYDDGSRQDERLVELFDNYEIKGTFHINSGLMNGREKISPGEISRVYKGHEISSHSVTHPDLSNMNEKELKAEILDDKIALEEMAGYKIRGLSYPFGSYNKLLLRLLREWGFLYGRVVPETNDFRLPSNMLLWRGSCHHSNAWHLAEKFITSLRKRIELFFIWGHSWELNDNDIHTNNWTYMKKICAMLGHRNDIWYATAGDVAEYLNAIYSLKIKDGTIYNPSAITVSVQHNDSIVNIGPGSSLGI
jgi:peptidoglycan-N-acetylglucosamine deacetylase